MSATGRRGGQWSGLVTGLIVLAVGVIFWLDQIDRIEASQYLQWWPVIPLVIGLANLIERQWATAIISIAIAAFFGLPLFGYAQPNFWILFKLFPLFISFAGVTLIAHALRAPALAKAEGGFQATAVMAGNVRRISAPSAGGQAVAVMGGCEIDVAATALKNNELVIDVLAFWGGIEVTVPRGWTVVNHVTAILGSVEDMTAAPSAAAPPRVVLRGSVIMGSVEVRNSVEAVS